MALSYQQIEKNWRSGRADAVYFFYGEEEFLRDELIRKSVELLLPDASLRSFNLDQFDAAECKLGDVLRAAKAYPVMAEVRLVICKNLERFFSGRGGKKTGDDNPLAEYLDEPNRSTVLILDSGKPGAKNTHPWKGLHANATAVEFAAMKDSEATEWIVERAERHGKNLVTRAAQMLVGLLGSDLRLLSSELEKIVTYVGSADEITVADVEATIGVSPTYNIFELTKAIGAGNKAKASEIALRMLEEDKSSYFLMFVMLGRYFEQVSIARELAAKRESEQAIAKALELFGGGAYFVKDYINAASRYGSAAKIDAATKALLRAEHQTRRAAVDHKLLIQRLMSEIVPA